MRKPSAFFVWTMSLLVGLCLTCTACGASGLPSSTATVPSPTRDPLNQVYALAWSPDGKRLAEASTDRTVHLWNILTGSPPLAYRGHQDEVWAVAWSPDGQYLASASDGGVIQLWNAKTGKQVWLLHL